jgi:hypothetical protein
VVSGVGGEVEGAAGVLMIRGRGWLVVVRGSGRVDRLWLCRVVCCLLCIDRSWVVITRSQERTALLIKGGIDYDWTSVRAFGR